MENSLNQRKLVTFSIQNILILLMVLFFGFTSLRFSVFGIGELILLFLCIVQITGQKDILVSLHNHVFSAFWLVYICIITIGYMINTFLNISPQSVLFDYGAYCVLLFLCFTFELLFKRTSIMNLYSLLRFIYFGGLLIIGILYLMFLRGNMYLFGYNLTYGGAEIFSPFANDYHQFAYFVAPLPFIGLFILKKERRMIYKLFAVLGIALSVKMGLATTSSTLVASWAMTTMIFFMLIIISKLKKYKKFISVSISFFCFITAAILISYEYIFTLINEFFSSDSNGENRFIIWQNAIKAWQFSPVLD